MQGTASRSAAMGLAAAVIVLVLGGDHGVDTQTANAQPAHAASWSEPELVATDTSIQSLEVDVDRAGTVTASWQGTDVDREKTTFYSAQRNASTGRWAPAAELRALPVIASTGDAAVAWYSSPDQRSSSLYVSSRPAGQSVWGDPIKITDSAESHQLAISDLGIITIAWRSHRVVKVARIDIRSGTRSDTSDLRLPPASIDWGVSVNQESAALAWWTQCLRPSGRPCRLDRMDERAPIRSIIQVALLPAGQNAWGSPETVTRHRPDWTRTLFLPSVVLDDTGTAHATWVLTGAGNQAWLLAARRQVNGSGWSAPQRLSAPRTHFDPFDSSSTALLATDTHGSSSAVWLASDEFGAALRPAGVTSWRDPAAPLLAVPCMDCSELVNVRLATAGGKALIAWGTIENERLEGVISARLLDISTGAAISEVELRATMLHHYPGNAEVALNETGAAVVAWYESAQQPSTWSADESGDVIHLAIEGATPRSDAAHTDSETTTADDYQLVVAPPGRHPAAFVPSSGDQAMEES